MRTLGPYPTKNAQIARRCVTLNRVTIRMCMFRSIHMAMPLALAMGWASACRSDAVRAPQSRVDPAPTAVNQVLANPASPRARSMATPPLEPGGGAGKRAPYFSAVNHRGEEISLGQVLKEGPAILLFYRGFW